MKLINNITKLLFWALCLWLFVRIFLFQVFKVPSDSMNQTFVDGDYIFVNKLAYGPRLPITPLSLHFGGQKHFLDWIQIPYLRLPGYSTVKANDILVFNLPADEGLPVDERKEYIKRCIGLPGDTVLIRLGNVYCNGRLMADLPQQVKWYAVKTVSEDSTPTDRYMTVGAADSLFKSDKTLGVEKKHIRPEMYSPSYFPHAPQLKWNPDNFGPLYIPKKGESISLNRANIILYQTLIAKYEGNTVTFKNDTVFINGTPASSYTFRFSYYFVLGDNRYNSIDSRFWGLLPEDHLIGKATFTVFSSAKAGSKKTKE